MVNESFEKERDENAEKKRQLFLHQKQTLDTFLATGAITKAQYDKSLRDLTVKMGMTDAEEKRV